MNNISSIQEFLNNREKNKIIIYSDILEKCFKRIVNAVYKNELFTIFIVPDFIIGKPKYNFSNCIQYLIFRLKKNGFAIKYFYPNALQISWKYQDFNKILDEEKYKLQTINKNQKRILPNNKVKNNIRNKNDIILNFNKKDNRKENKKQLKTENKFKAINEFIPRTEIFNKY